MLTFDQAFDRLIGNEGGYVCNPADPGGETNWGISKRSYPNIDIKHLTRDQAKTIYKRDFWDQIGTDAHPAIVFQVFDFAVNSGISTAIRKLQAALGVADDGVFGPISKRALASADESALAAARRGRWSRRFPSMPRCSSGRVRPVS